MRKIIAILVTLVIAVATVGFIPAKDTSADTIGTAELYVTRLYNVAFDRDPDEDGYYYYVNALYNGDMTATEVAGAIFFSDEYRAFNKTNQEYVFDLYDALLGRQYDKTGFVFWVDFFNQCHICIMSTDCAVFNGFTQSDEFRDVCAELDLEVGTMYVTNERAREYAFTLDNGGSVYFPF